MKRKEIKKYIYEVIIPLYFSIDSKKEFNKDNELYPLFMKIVNSRDDIFEATTYTQQNLGSDDLTVGLTLMSYSEVCYDLYKKAEKAERKIIETIHADPTILSKINL